MLLELTKGAALLLALCYSESFVRRYMDRTGLRQEIALGVLYGSICIIGMMTPMQFSDGIIFDARSVVVAVAALLGGPVCGAIAAAFAIAYRLWLGGAGALIGTGVIATSFAAGYLYRDMLTRYGWTLGAKQLFVFGFILHVACIAWFLFLPAGAAADVLRDVAVPFVAVFTPATVLLGWLIRDSKMQIKIAEDLKATSQALGESERRFRAIFDHSPNAITLKDENGVYLVANRTFARWNNVDADEIIGKTRPEIHRPNQLEEIALLEQQVLNDEQVVSCDSTRKFADGVERDVSVTKLPVKLACGEKSVVLTMLTDISDIKKTETELRRAHDQAVAANLSKSEFLARMSHELRTPLNAILGFSDVLRHDEFGAITKARTAEYANDIYTSASVLLELVNHLLDIAAIEGGRVRINYETIDVPPLLEECVNTLDARLTAKEISMEVLAPDCTVPLFADRRALKQILLNLLMNAVKFTPAGGNITLGVTQSDAETSIVVSDTGVGIEDDLVELLLSREGVPAANSHVTQDGWGLGLSVVRGLTELHGGRIDIESHVHQGTLVAVAIPNGAQACA